MSELLLSVDFWKFAAPLIGAVIAWFVNEWRKRIADQYQRKEANYKELLRTLNGFYVGAPNSDTLRVAFLEQLNLAWLYCPDEVIKKGYAFLDTIHKNSAATDADKELAMGALVSTIRADLVSRKLVSTTQLCGSDFKHLTNC